MERFAERALELTEKQSDGATLLEHLQKRQEETGRNHIDLPPLHPDLIQLWHLFMDFSLARQSTQTGLQPMLWTEFEAFGRLRGVTMCPDMIRLLRKLEQILLRFSAEQMKKAITSNERNDGRPG